MKITEFCINKPIFTIVLMLVLVLVGGICYLYLPVRWIPNVSPPVVSILTDYPGASPSLIEEQITTPIEDSLASVDGIDTVISNSKFGQSQINISFKLNRNINVAVEDVRSSVERIKNNLPIDVKNPIVSKQDPNSSPILFLAFFDKTRTTQQVSDYVERFIKPQLEAITGVGNIVTFGEQKYAMRIWLNPSKMAARGVTINDIANALLTQNVELPGGQIRTQDRFYTVLTNEKFSSKKQFENIIIRDNNNNVVRFSDIGRSVVGSEDIDNSFRVNGKPAMALGIIPQSTANPLGVTDSVLKVFKSLKNQLPTDMSGNVVFNQTIFTRASIHSVYEALLEAIILVFFVVYLFLGRMRFALIPIITIPVCLIGTFIILYLLNYSINTITLLALVLAIGLVVDDAIVVLENIGRHVDAGMKSMLAAKFGSNEIIFPIIGMTISLAAVYIPVTFIKGVTGKFFQEFAFTLSGAVLLSGAVALTLSPMMCARILTNVNRNSYSIFLAKFNDFLLHQYKFFLRKALQRKVFIMFLLILVAVFGYFLFCAIPSELAPVEDMGTVSIFVNAPHDASFNYTDSIMKRVEREYESLPGVESYLAQSGVWSPASAYSFLLLQPWSQRSFNSKDVAGELVKKTNDIPGAKINVMLPPPPLTWFSTNNGSNIVIAFTTTGSYQDLYNYVSKFKQKIAVYPGLTNVDSQLDWNTQGFRINVDREKVADLKIPTDRVNGTIETMLAGRDVTRFLYDGKEYNVIVQMRRKDLADPNVINKFYVRSNLDKMIPLSNFANIEPISFPNNLTHFSRLRSDELTTNIASGYKLGEVIKYLNLVAGEMKQNNIQYSFLGEARQFINSSETILIAFGLGLIFIYLVLSALFESFIDPLIILFVIPFSLIGALLALKITGCTLNIYSNIALITLMGLIAKHGILITDFANKKLKENVGLIDAIVDAASLRLRPILMTTFAMVLGALPLAISSGPGSEVRHQVGWVIVGGMLMGTFFSLIVVPVMYVVIKARIKKRIFIMN